MSGSRSPNSPGSPERSSSPKAQLPEPPKGSRYTLSLNDGTLFKAKSSTMSHSFSMPNLDLADANLSPPSQVRAQSPVAQASSVPCSPESPSSPLSGRHSLLSSPVFDSKQSHKVVDPEMHRFHLLASIEDAIRSSMSDEYSLVKFAFVASHSYSNPEGNFHCVINTVAGKEVFNEQYPILKLLSVEKFVAAFNRDCKLFQLNAEQIIRGYDQNNFILSPLKPGFQNAVFVAGEDQALGSWKRSNRMNYSDHHHAWRFTLPAGMTESSYKFQVGAFAEGKNPETNRLQWEAHDGNRQLLPVQRQQKTPRFSK